MHINIDIHFPSAPCHILSLDQQDLMGTHIVNVYEGLVKTWYDWFGAELGTWDHKQNDYRATVDGARKGLEAGEGCGISGWLQVNRVPGNFHISTHDYNNVLHELQTPINLTHSIIELNFAYKFYVDSIRDKFGYANTQSLSPLNGMGTLHDKHTTQTKYHFQLVPTNYRSRFG